MANTRLIEHQSIIDVTIQECGSIASLFDFALINGISITEEAEIGNKLEIPPLKAKPEIANFLKKQSINIATAVPTSAADYYIQQLFENGLFQPGLFE